MMVHLHWPGMQNMTFLVTICVLRMMVSTNIAWLSFFIGLTYNMVKFLSAFCAYSDGLYNHMGSINIGLAFKMLQTILAFVYIRWRFEKLGVFFPRGPMCIARRKSINLTGNINKIPKYLCNLVKNDYFMLLSPDLLSK